MDDLRGELVERELERLGATIGRPVSVVPVTASTNDDARRAASMGAPHGASFLADTQTRGRGRSGHAWHSPPGENLYLSVVLRPKVEPHALPPLALILGVCVARVVDEAIGGPARAGVKWPNDVLVDGKKIAGVLVETTLRGSRIDAVVSGIGLNVCASSFPDELAGRATSLRVLGARELDRARIAARLLAEIGGAVGAFEASGLVSFVAELERRDVLRGAHVEVAGIAGIADGIDVDGYLRVKGDRDEVHRVGSGSVTIKRPAGDRVSF